MGLSSSDGNGLDWSQKIGNDGLEIGRQRLPCPRCESPNTKFCYYNNYSRLQPRHFCRACRRHWTAGGTLRNVPVGGGARKNKRPKSAAAAAGVSAVGSPDDVLYQLMLRPPLVSSSDGSTISSSAVDWRDEAVVIGPLPEDELLNLMPGGSAACPWPQDCWAWWDDVADPADPGLC